MAHQSTYQPTNKYKFHYLNLFLNDYKKENRKGFEDLTWPFSDEYRAR